MNFNIFQELFLDSNEIKIDGGMEIAKAIANKENLKILMLDANQFGKILIIILYFILLKIIRTLLYYI